MQYVYKKKSKIAILQTITLLLGLFSTLFLLVHSLIYEGQYNNIFIWPLSFTFFSLLCYSPFSKCKPEHELGLSLVTVFELLPRYVLYPIILQFVSNDYTGVTHIGLTPSDFSDGLILGAFELLGLTLFVFMFERLTFRRNGHKNKLQDRALRLSGHRIIYISYIIFAVIIYLLIGRHYNIIQFFSMESGYKEIASNIYITLVKYVVSIALALTTLMIINTQKNRYVATSNKLHIIVSVFVAMLYTGVIVGESRSTQIAIGVLMTLILAYDFPKAKKKIAVTMAISVLAVVLSITFFRTGSSTLIENNAETIADKLQVYFGGPTSLSQSIRVLKESLDINLSKMLFDFIRSIFPFNLLLKNNAFTTSQIYNLLLYSGKFTHGHIVFGASYGYTYFGYLGLPIIICLNYFLISKANEVYYGTSSYEVKYVSGYCMIRLVAAFLVNTPTILGSVTQHIGTFGLLIVISNMLTKNKKYEVRTE